MSEYLSITHPELAAEWHPTKNGDLSPDRITRGSAKKVWWLGECGHEWEASVLNRTHGTKCPVCSGKKIVSGVNDLATTHPALAAIWHPTKNGGISPREVSAGSNRKVWWLCPVCKHEWESVIAACKSDSPCPNCSKKKMIRGADDLAATHPKLAAEWHPTKNGDLTPDSITHGSNKKVWWLGACGHEWQAIISSRSAGNGCPFCSGHRVWRGYNDLATTAPALAAEWHPTKNGDLTPMDVSVGSVKEVWWQGACGHEWKKSINLRYTLELGCPVCSNRRLVLGVNDLLHTSPALAAEWHPTKNEKLAPDMVTASFSKKVWWLGACGHEWQATVGERTKGKGCPYCANHNRKVLSGFNDLMTVNPKLAAEWHPTKNGDLTPDKVTRSSAKKVWWQCKNGHEWQATIASRNAGRNCPVCARRVPVFAPLKLKIE